MNDIAMNHDTILVLDFGSQYTQLIGRRIREQSVYSAVKPYTLSIDEIRAMNPRGIILSGGPDSTLGENAPTVSPELFDLNIPILGICYGAQLMAKFFGGKVVGSSHREYGRTQMTIMSSTQLFVDIPIEPTTSVWMSHGDSVSELPKDFIPIAKSDDCPFIAFADESEKLYALQFHPEVSHTMYGNMIIERFVVDICGSRKEWNMTQFLQDELKKTKEHVGSEGNVICGLSGGVDSSVAASVVHRAIGERLTCIFVDNGLLRRSEREQIESMVNAHLNLQLIVVDAAERFLLKLKGVIDPEAKRKIIGNEFIYVFEEEANKLSDAKFLVQGTLYPDVIESVATSGPASMIKSHHNVGGLPENMNLILVEPLRELYKDEVRKLGIEMELPLSMVMRQPFPGPGLAIRCIGEVTAARLEKLRDSDAIILEEIIKADLYDSLWQAFAVLLSTKSVGVMGDKRTYDETIALRAVTSTDGMTADWARLPFDVLETISRRITNEVSGIGRVVYDITSKPPGTIEWE